MATSRTLVVGASLFLALLCTGTAQALPVDWPGEPGSTAVWIALPCPGLNFTGSYNDPHDDFVGAPGLHQLDIVGYTVSGTAYPAGYKASSSDYLMFRMRLDDFPDTIGPQTQYVWQFLIEIHPNSVPLHDHVDFSLQLDRKTDNEVEFVPATPGGPLFAQINLSHTPVDEHWSGAINDYSRVVEPTGDLQELGDTGGGDAFLDVAIPWTAFSAAGPWGTGLPMHDLNSFEIYLATSNSHIQVNKDVQLQCGQPAAEIPEPATLTLLALGGLGLLARRRRKR